MAVGSGLSATLGIVTETIVGTPVAVTRFVEFDSETMAEKKHTTQGQGMRGGALYRRSARRIQVAREFSGDVMFDVTTNGMGLWLQHMLGSFSTTATSIGGGLFRQIHNAGSLQGKTFTTQIVYPDTSGVLTQEAFTYTGCKIIGWELSVAQGQQAKLKATIDALDQATPSNGTASTALSSLTTAGATSLSTTAAITSGQYVVVDIGALAEVVQLGTVTGSGPYVGPIVTPGGLKFAHAVGAYVGSATNVNYGAATALQAASYTAGTNMFGFQNGSLVAGGSTAAVSGVWTNTGGQVVANVRNVTFKVSNPVKQDRWGLGSQVRSEQIENNFRDVNLTIEVEYNGRAFYDAYQADAALALNFSLVTPAGAVLSFYVPVGFQDDGGQPNVAGPDILIQKLAVTVLDDGTNGAIQAIYTSTDAAV
jgi:hypothetical protein